jgi:uncharacterized membrane protein YtjA (UPF0391 family)
LKVIYALVFAILSLVAGAIGLADISVGNAVVAKIIYFAAAAMCVWFLALAKFSQPEADRQ